MPSPTLSKAGVEAARERGWLVEMIIDNAPWWWAIGLPNEENWTRDSLRALRFGRKEDAESFISDMGWTEVVATEHLWSDARAAAQTTEAPLGYVHHDHIDRLQSGEPAYSSEQATIFRLPPFPEAARHWVALYAAPSYAGEGVVVPREVATEAAAKIADKVADEYRDAEDSTFRGGVRRAAVMIARRIRSSIKPIYGSDHASSALTPAIASPRGAGPDVRAALIEARGDFEAIRLALVKDLNEPGRTAFWRAVNARTRIDDALASPPSDGGAV